MKSSSRYVGEPTLGEMDASRAELKRCARTHFFPEAPPAFLSISPV